MKKDTPAVGCIRMSRGMLEESPGGSACCFVQRDKLILRACVFAGVRCRVEGLEAPGGGVTAPVFGEAGVFLAFPRYFSGGLIDQAGCRPLF